MSDPTPGPKSGSRARLPYHLAPWLAVAAMAAATLWPARARKKISAPSAETQPRLLTPAELDRAEPLAAGRAAHWPTGMPPLVLEGHPLGAPYREMGRDRLATLSGGITYYILLATFPAIAAFVSLYGLVADPAGGGAPDRAPCFYGDPAHRGGKKSPDRFPDGPHRRPRGTRPWAARLPGLDRAVDLERRTPG